MKGVLIFVALLFVSVGFMQAMDTPQSLEELCPFLESHSEELQNYPLPSFFPYKNEVFNVYLAEEFFLTFALHDGILAGSDCDTEAEEPTYDIFVQNAQTLNEVLTSEDKFGLFKEKLNNKEIDIQGKSFLKKVKQKIVTLILDIFT